MGGRFKWEIAPQLIISAVKSKTQDGNLTNSGANILTSGPHGHWCSSWNVDLNKVLDMTDSVNPNYVSLHSADFSLLMNPNRAKKERYITIVYNMLQFPAKGIFSANQVRVAVHFYDDKLSKIGGKQRMVTTDVRESHMFISDGLSYLPVRCPTNE